MAEIGLEYISNLRTEIELLKKDLTYISSLFEKMDRLITKIEDQQDTIVDKTNNLIEHKDKCNREELAELYTVLEKTETSIHNRINHIETILLSEIRTVGNNLNNHISDENTLTNNVKKFVWLGTGGFAIFMWVINNLDIIKKIFGK